MELESGVRTFQRPANEKTWLRSHMGERWVMTVDPVCKMEVDPKSAKWKSTYNGKEYFFCAPGCKKQFDKDPAKYTQG